MIVFIHAHYAEHVPLVFFGKDIQESDLHLGIATVQRAKAVIEQMNTGDLVPYNRYIYCKVNGEWMGERGGTARSW